LRVIPLGHRLQQGRRQQRLALAQEAAQHGVDHALGARGVRVGVGRRDGLVDHGKFFIRLDLVRRRHQRQRAGQQRADQRFRRLGRHQRDQRLALAQLAHGAVGDVLHGAARLRQGFLPAPDLGQRLRQVGAGADHGHRVGGADQAECEGIGFQAGLEAALQRRFQFARMAGAQLGRCSLCGRLQRERRTLVHMLIPE
jgi:hypothetical protein